MLPCSIQSQLREAHTDTIFWIYKIFLKLFLAFHNCTKRDVQFLVNILKICYQRTRFYAIRTEEFGKNC
jgi:hypothetical protein